MTREIARREIDSLDFYLQNHTDDYSAESHMAMMMAIEALEQEPCGKDINVPATDGKKDVLDKVRAEIEQITDTMGVSYNQYVSKIDVLNIIDKYKVESEEKK